MHHASVRVTRPVAVTLHQPVAPGEVRTITGRVLGAMHVDGQVHHFRFVDGDGALFLVPPAWIEHPDNFPTTLSENVARPEVFA